MLLVVLQLYTFFIRMLIEQQKAIKVSTSSFLLQKIAFISHTNTERKTIDCYSPGARKQSVTFDFSFNNERVVVRSKQTKVSVQNIKRCYIFHYYNHFFYPPQYLWSPDLHRPMAVDLFVFENDRQMQKSEEDRIEQSVNLVFECLR